MTEIVIATQQDYKIIDSLAKIIWPHTYNKILSQEQSDYMYDMMYSASAYNEQLALKNHHYLLARNGKNYLGFAAYELNAFYETTKIHKLYVLPETQGTGTGTLLLSKIEKIAKKHGSTKITLNVNRYNSAVDFYLKHGFAKAGEVDVEIGNGYLMEDFIMVKEI